MISFYYYKSSCIAFAFRLIQDWVWSYAFKWRDYVNQLGFVFVLYSLFREYYLILMFVVIIICELLCPIQQLIIIFKNRLEVWFVS
jgi:hypothetical protein